MESDSKSNILSSSIELADYTLSNRMVMAPMSCLYHHHNLSHPEIVDYYTKRASAGLIITEPTLISPPKGFDGCPGIYSRQQIKKWREITEAVRDCGGKIFLQLWYCEDETSFCHLGESLHINGLAINKDFPTVVKLFRRAAQNAMAADFDGVEIHAAFGYLDERHFQRDLKFSHNIEQQAELLISIIEEVASVWNEDRVGVRITPEVTLSGVKDVTIIEDFYDLFDAFNFYDIAYVHLVESVKAARSDRQIFLALSTVLRSIYHGTVILSCQNDLERAKQVITARQADLVSFDNFESLVAC